MMELAELGVSSQAVGCTIPCALRAAASGPFFPVPLPIPWDAASSQFVLEGTCFSPCKFPAGYMGEDAASSAPQCQIEFRPWFWMYSCSLWRVGGSLKWFSSWRELLEHRAEQSSCRLPLKGAPVLQSPFTCHKAKLCSNLSRRLQLNNMNCSARLLAA